MFKITLDHVKNIGKFIGIICLLLFGITNTSSAQELPEPLYISEVGTIQNIYWSSDEENLVFQYAQRAVIDGVLTTSQLGPWFTYRANEGREQNLVESADRPQALTNMNSRFSFPPQAVTSRGFQSFLFPSPNQRYIAYATGLVAGLDSYNIYALAIVDLESGNATIFEDVLLNFSSNNMFIDYEIRWSANSQALIITSALMLPGATRYYVNLGNADSEPYAINFENTYFNNELINITRLLDISEDGNRVLTYAQAESGNNIFVWNANQPDQSTSTKAVPTGGLSGGAFSPEGEGWIYYIDGQGLHIYNLITEESQLLNPEINASRFGFAYFSPNGNQIALYDFVSDNHDSIYLYNINEES